VSNTAAIRGTTQFMERALLRRAAGHRGVLYATPEGRYGSVAKRAGHQTEDAIGKET